MTHRLLVKAMKVIVGGHVRAHSAAAHYAEDPMHIWMSLSCRLSWPMSFFLDRDRIFHIATLGFP